MARIYEVKIANPVGEVPWVGMYRGTHAAAVHFAKVMRKKMFGSKEPLPAMTIRRVRK